MPDCEISFDMSRIDLRATSDLLMASYWGAGRNDEIHRRAFANSLCV
ncbi:MAG: N-acetyltransferase, partial [Mesorhizobium sp.]